MSDSQMKQVGVYGLGYVGCVSAACLASRGHRVVGIDVNRDKVELLRQGKSPVVEEKIGDLTAEVVAAGTLAVTTDARAAVASTDISLICVGTPSTPGGGLSTNLSSRSPPRLARRWAIRTDGTLWSIAAQWCRERARTC